MTRFVMLAAVCLLAACASSAFAEAQMVNVDELPHKTIQLPNGQKAEVVVYQEHNWRVVNAAVLSGTNDEDPDVCFEGKFDVIVPPKYLKLHGIPALPSPKETQWATIALDDRLKARAGREFKRNDNLWFCGTLRKTGPRELEFVAVDILKQLPDLERYKLNIERLKTSRDGDALIELGHRIRQQGKADITDLTDFDKLSNLCDTAFDQGLTLKEKTLKPDDADGMYALALQWRELRNKNSKFRELVERCLKVNPEHPKATHVAEDEWGWILFRNKWRPKSQVDEILKAEKDQQVSTAAAERAAQEARDRERKQASQERPLLLATRLAALRTADQKARDSAILSLGEAGAKSSDPGFSYEAVDILANLGDAASVPALVAVGRSELADIRRQVLEALAWRGSRQDQPALTALGAALATEREVSVAHAGVEAVAALPRGPAAGVLVAALNTKSSAVLDEIVEGLKIVTKQPLTSKKDWEDWWSKNKTN